MRSFRLALLAASALTATPALADTDAERDARIARLEAAVEALAAENTELRREVADLRREHPPITAPAAPLPTAVVQAPPAPRAPNQQAEVTMAGGRPTFASSDGQFTMALRGVFQLDAARYSQETPGPLATDFRRGSFNDAVENERARDLGDGTNFRRVRIGVEGRVFQDFDYNVLFEFGGSGNEEAGRLVNAYAQYNVARNLRVRAGAYAPPANLEDVASTNGSLFAERAASAEIARNLAGGDGRVSASLFVTGSAWQASASITGNTTGALTFDEQLGIVLRASIAPWRSEGRVLHLGLNSSTIINPAATGPDIPPGVATPIRLRERPEIRVDATRLIDTGSIDAEGLTEIGLEAGLVHGPFHLQGEAFDFRLRRRASALDDPRFSGWYVQGSWILTGESRRYTVATGSFDGPRPARPFNPGNGAWGAFELGLRYSVMNLNFREGDPGTAPVAEAVRGGEQTVWTVGLNWYPVPAVKFMAAFQDVSVDRLSPGGTAFGAGATPPAGAQVGQDLQIWSLRTQYAF